MVRDGVEDIEIHLLLEALYRRYHYDFRHYAQASIKRRLKQARDSILALPLVPSTVRREVEIRRATGETQKLRRLSVEQRRSGLGSSGSTLKLKTLK